MYTIEDLTTREIRDSYLTREEVENVRRPLEQASVLPLRVYDNRAYFEREVDSVIRPGWNALARIDQLKEKGSFVTGEIAGEPVVVVRGKDDVIRALSNVCRHRGTQIIEGCGVAKAMVCPYHTWTYNLDGTLRGAPHMGKVDDFDRKAITLPEFRMEIWNGFIFVNLDDDAAPLADAIAPLTEAMEPFGLADWETVPWIEKTVDWNWKISLENFTEAYHHVGVHKDSIGKVSLAEKALYEETNDAYSLFFVHIDFEDDSVPGEEYPFAHVPGLPEKYAQYSPVVNIYPTFHMVMGPNFILWMQITIDAVDRHTMTWRWLIPPGASALPDVKERLEALDHMMAPIVAEDLGFMPRVKAIVKSRAFKPGRYCDQERSVHQMHRYLLDRMEQRGTLVAPDS